MRLNQPALKLPENYQIDRRSAVVSCQDAVDCIKRQEFDAAEQHLLSALNHRPSSALAFKLLGDCYIARSDKESAAVCYKNSLPEKHIGAGDKSLVTSDSTEYSRVQVFESTICPVPAPGIIVDQSAFTAQQITSNANFVDVVSNGTLWHDDLNTSVMTESGTVIPEHTVGCDALIHAIQAKHRPVQIEGRAILLGARGAHNYYHWTTDIAPKLILLKEAGLQLDVSDTVVVSRADTSFAMQLLELFGVRPEQILATETHSPYLVADEIVAPCLHNKMGYGMGGWLPVHLKQSLGIDEGRAQTRKLFINRKPDTAAGRTLENSQDVEALFADKGFEVIYPETLSVIEQARLFATAKVVAGIHGAGLANVVYCQPGTTIIEFYGAHIAPCYWLISALTGFNYFHHPCATANNQVANRHAATLSLPLAEAERLLDYAGVTS